MLTKNLTLTEMDEAGKGLALIADLDEVDHDGDGYKAGAFDWKDQWAPLLTAHNQDMVPFGKARIFEHEGKAFAELHLNLDTQAGKDWHSALRFDLKTGNPVQEWSYGYTALEADPVMRGLQKGRVLKKVEVQEVSTVVRGAGQGTRTIDMKGLKAALKEGEFEGLIEGLTTMAETLRGDPGLLSATGRKQLTEIHTALGEALVDPTEVEAKHQADLENLVAHNLTRDARQRLSRYFANR